LVYVDDVNILGEGMHIIQENAEALVVACKENGLEVNAEKRRYVFISRDQHPGQNHDINIGNKLFERVEEFKYLITTAKIKKSFVSVSACYHSVQIFCLPVLSPKMFRYANYNFACCFVWA
jgi:hypothetical protein